MSPQDQSGSMRGRIQMVFAALIIFTLIYFCECQITFSRSWVRGKLLPGEDNGSLGSKRDRDDPKVLTFLRNAKAVDFDPSPSLFSRDSKALINFRTKFLQDILHRWRYPTATRFKVDEISSSERGQLLNKLIWTAS